jgi:hypothetical protein
LITIKWDTIEVKTAEDGGDTVNTTVGSVTIDGAESEQYARSADISQHAIERGSDIADHVRPGNLRMSFDCRISRDPDTTRESLTYLISNGILCDIETDIAQYLDVVLIGFEEERNYRTGEILKAILTAQQIRRVESDEVDAPSPLVERGRRRSSAGAQSTATATTAAEADPPSTDASNREQSISILRRAINFFDNNESI